MHNKQLILAACMSVICSGQVLAQDQYYDITANYLENAGFDSDFDYPATATGNVAQEILDVKGWTKDISVDYTITGVYQFGTQKTFNKVPIPAVGYDGTANGGCLALSTGWKQSMLFNQDVNLPAGKYAIVTAYYNCNTETGGTSQVGWLPTGRTAKLSKVEGFEAGVWKTDTVFFQLSRTQAGKIQIGYTAIGGKGSDYSAKLAFDFIKLLRDTPYGKADVNVIKTDLRSAIKTANTLYGDGSGNEAETLKQAIDKAQATADNEEATAEEVKLAITELETAVDAYQWANPSGDVPTVTTDSRYARGATIAFGRMTAKGTNITEQGFCWSETPEPTIYNQKTTKYLENNGKIYCLEDLKPATLYYMRAYAITKGRQVGYGDIIKFYTIPKGNMGYSIREGGDAAAVKRITEAVKSAVNYWNNLTSIKGVSTSVGYNAGVPTAECSYGCWMSVGSNASYQRTGTILHELLHGIGVIPWADTEWSRHNLRSGVNGDGFGTGNWLGDRVTDVLRFWDNTTDSKLNGDYQHMWPYGINGASEDNGSQVLYYGNGLICQALGEDGLQHTGSSFAEPYYALNVEDNVKYYIKNESPDGGLYSAYLVPTANGTLQWRTFTAEQAIQNDSTAWTISFTPNNQYYQFKNVATGYYLNYSGTGTNGIRTANHATPSSNDNFHLMRSRIKVSMGSKKIDQRGYWIIHPENNWQPTCLSAGVNGTVTTATFNIANNATKQRWLILSEEEMPNVEKASVDGLVKELDEAYQKLKALTDVPHSEDEAGIDEATQNVAEQVKNALTSSTDQLTTSSAIYMLNQIQEATGNFLRGATPVSAAQPFDVTYLIANPGMDDSEGWSIAPALSYSCGEFYQKTFDMSQTFQNMPAGTYRFAAKGFQRPGSSSAAYNDYVTGADKVSAYIYAGSDKEKLAHIASEAQNSKLGGSESSVGTPTQYIPNNMQAASIYFGKGLYENSVVTTLANDNASLKVGIKSTSMPSNYWCIFDDFRLYFYGNINKEVVTAIEEIQPEAPAFRSERIYSLDGRLMGTDASQLQTLKKGIYIIGNKKVVVK